MTAVDLLRQLRKVSIPNNWAEIMMLIGDGEMTITDLARATDIDKSNLYKHASRMRNIGWLASTIAPNNACAYQLTERGQEMLRRIHTRP